MFAVLVVIEVLFSGGSDSVCGMLFSSVTHSVEWNSEVILCLRELIIAEACKDRTQATSL